MKPTTVLSAAALLVSSAQAHISMQSPLPYNELFDTAPLNPSGSDFPCKKGDTGYSAKSVANATVGQPIQVSFKGSADHSGGSCQFVLSKDGFSSLAPTSKFKVIYSVMGGCPGISGAENTYSVPIPSEVPSGSYTMGWTWFNKIGNREMYMNCATMAVSGGTGTDADFSSLPDMAVYNINSVNDCKTSETGDVQFPNPGKYVLTATGFSPKPPTGSCATGGSASPIAPGTSTGGGSVAPGGGGSSSGSPGAGGGSSATSNPGAGSSGSFDDGQYHPDGSGTGKASASIKASSPASPVVATTLVTTASPTTEAPKTAMPTAAPANGTSSDPTGGFIGKTPTPPAPAAAAPSSGAASPIPALAPAAGQACSTEGAVVCSPDGKQFGLCNFGKVQFAAVSEGMKCADGKIVGRRARKVRSSV